MENHTLPLAQVSGVQTRLARLVDLRAFTVHARQTIHPTLASADQLKRVGKDPKRIRANPKPARFNRSTTTNA